MGRRNGKTKGGVRDHAVDRVKRQYNSSLDKEEIRMVLRESKNKAEIKNGAYVISEEDIRRLKIEIVGKRILMAIVSNNEIKTVMDMPIIPVESARNHPLPMRRIRHALARERYL